MDENNREKFARCSQDQIRSAKELPLNTFRVYDRVLEKHRYVPREWTQEEFEAALPERFKRKVTTLSQNPEDINIDKCDFRDDNTIFNKSQSSSFQNRFQKKVEVKDGIKNVKVIFENTDCPNENFEIELERRLSQGKSRSYGKYETNETEELERCKDSEAKVKLIENETVESCVHSNQPREIAKASTNFSQTSENSHNKYAFYFDAVLRCLLQTKPFRDILSNGSQNTPILTKLKCLKQSGINENSRAILIFDLFPKFGNFQNFDQVLVTFLETLIDEIGDEQGRRLRSLIQGKFCHIKTCKRCESIEKDFEIFLLLNPKAPAIDLLNNNNVLDISFLSCNSDGTWQMNTQQFVVLKGKTITHLVDELLSSPEFDACNSKSIRIGEVFGNRVVRRFEGSQELATIKGGSNVFAFNVLNFNAAGSNTLDGMDISYHLYFACGLCLSDGKDVDGLFVHTNCGGMICRDCLDVITQSYQDWELCPCAICEQPIDLDKELCRATPSRATQKELGFQSSNAAESSILCYLMFRVDRHVDRDIELFGCPLMVFLPRQVTGYHLYRCVGYLLPNALPMKDRTSFTLHAVDKSGLACSACSLVSCTGCLIRIDDNVIITQDTNLVVHFDDLAEESKKNFGILRCGDELAASNSKGLFDSILQSCVRESTSARMFCSKCSSPCKVSSSIAEFPMLLMIHLNQQYSSQTLAPGTTLADISRFLVLQHGNDAANSKLTAENLPYQLTAAALVDCKRDATPSYKALASNPSSDAYMLYEASDATPTDPYKTHVTHNSLLFYQPEETAHSTEVQRVLKMPLLVGQHREEIFKTQQGGSKSYGKKLHAIREETMKAKNPSKIRRSSGKQPMNSRLCDKQIEPGEYLLGAGLAENRQTSGAVKKDGYGSRLSLGEVFNDATDIDVRMSADFDGISPISGQDTHDAKTMRETKKLMRAVKREDAYGIVCALKRGANPCLLINEVTALHLAVGIKSDQRCSMVAYLLKHAKDVNMATGDGTTPSHVAAAWGHLDALELLLAHGGNPFDLTDQEGNSAFDIASKDCSAFLQLQCQSDGNSAGLLEPSTSSRVSMTKQKPTRLEDVVRANLTLPSFVHESSNRSRMRLRWLKRFRSFRKKSSGMFRSLRRISSIRRRSRIGVMIESTREQNGNTAEEQ